MIFTSVEALTEFDAYFKVENILPNYMRKHKFLLICSPLPTRGLGKRIIIMREPIIEWLEEDCWGNLPLSISYPFRSFLSLTSQFSQLFNCLFNSSEKKNVKKRKKKKEREESHIFSWCFISWHDFRNVSWIFYKFNWILFLPMVLNLLLFWSWNFLPTGLNWNVHSWHIHMSTVLLHKLKNPGYNYGFDSSCIHKVMINLEFQGKDLRILQMNSAPSSMTKIRYLILFLHFFKELIFVSLGSIRICQLESSDIWKARIVRGSMNLAQNLYCHCQLISPAKL